MKQNDFTDEELANIILGPEDDIAPNKPRRVRTRSSRLSRSRDFSRTWLSWFEKPRWRQVFPPTVRLWLAFWIRSREGQEPVELTSRIAADAAIRLEHRHRYASELEKLGLVQIERRGRSIFVLTTSVRRPLV
jgi:hypothetical protein